VASGDGGFDPGRDERRADYVGADRRHARLNRHVERVSEPSGKTNHWGKRKLARHRSFCGINNPPPFRAEAIDSTGASGVSAPFSLTDCRRFFEQPATARQRQYEALRAYFLAGTPTAEVARSFGYSPGAFRVLCHDFRHGRLPELFASGRAGQRVQPKKSRAHEQIVALRKRNYSVYEISLALKEQGMPLSATAVREVLAEEGFAPLPRRRDEERPQGVRPSTEAVANVRDFVLSPREFTTRMGGLFLFIHDLVRLDADALALGAKLPGSGMIPAGHALRAALALKLWSVERKSHVMALVADEGLALFCGLNAMPKKSFLSAACSICGTGS
jgi:transposase